MSLKYFLAKNHLVAQPNAYMAVVHRGDMLSFEQLADLMVQRGSTLTRSDIIATENLQFEVEQEMLQLGFTVAGRWMSMTPRIRGSFNGPADSYDPSRHNVRIGFTPNKFTRRFQSDIHVQRVNVPKTSQPTLFELIDYASKEVNQQLTVGKTVKITGANLSFDLKDPQQGIFFVEAETGKVLTELHEVMEHKPSWLLFEIPSSLPADKYVHLEVRSKCNTRELRKGQLQEVLLTVG